MIERYLDEKMKKIFSEQFRFEKFLEVEIAATEAFMNMGVVPLSDYNKIKDNACFDLKVIKEIEAQTHHDVVAFTRAVSMNLGEEKKWIHYSLTSTDVVDTASALIYKSANELIQNEMEIFLNTLKNKALQYKDYPCIGRTHGIHADITSFGLKFALYYDEMKRNMERFKSAREEVEVGKISGAVGNFAFVPSEVQDRVCAKLNIKSANISTQVLQRDRHAYYSSVLTILGCTLEKIAVEIRNLQRTEIHECEEYFDKGQKGSSAMPHKRNPISSENITGCSRMLRGYLLPVLEDVALYHERDISHSSVERVALSDQISLVYYMLKRFNKVVDNLIVYKENMLENIYKTKGVIFSQRILTALIDKGWSREKAYDYIQPLCLKSYNESLDLRSLLEKEPKILEAFNNDLDFLFDLNFYLKNVDEIYHRVGIL